MIWIYDSDPPSFFLENLQYLEESILSSKFLIFAFWNLLVIYCLEPVFT